jgi:hypothetical protein
MALTLHHATPDKVLCMKHTHRHINHLLTISSALSGHRGVQSRLENGCRSSSCKRKIYIKVPLDPRFFHLYPRPLSLSMFKYIKEVGRRIISSRKMRSTDAILRTAEKQLLGPKGPVCYIKTHVKQPLLISDVTFLRQVPQNSS